MESNNGIRHQLLLVAYCERSSLLEQLFDIYTFCFYNLQTLIRALFSVVFGRNGPGSLW